MGDVFLIATIAVMVGAVLVIVVRLNAPERRYGNPSHSSGLVRIEYGGQAEGSDSFPVNKARRDIAIPGTREPKCPYCNIELSSFPSAHRKCPHCEKSIKVASRDGAKYLFTESGWRDFQKAKKAEAFRNRWMRQLSYVGIAWEDYDRTAPANAERKDRMSAERDTLWALLNEALLSCRGYGDRWMIYWNMARMTYECGQDHLQYARLAEEMRLKEMRRMNGSTHVEIVWSGICEVCKAQDGKKITIEEALKQMPLPHPDCLDQQSKAGRGWCTCSYVDCLGD